MGAIRFIQLFSDELLNESYLFLRDLSCIFNRTYHMFLMRLTYFSRDLCIFNQFYLACHSTDVINRDKHRHPDTRNGNNFAEVLVFISLSLFLRRILFTNPSARAGYDTRSIFKRSSTGLNSEFSFS